MGTQTMIDLIGSMVVFGWLALMALSTNNANNENMQTHQGELLVQENLVAITHTLEYDFRKIGFCANPDRMPDPTRAIVEADSTRLSFLTDVDHGSGPDGIVDTVTYYLGSTTELAGTPNPRDRYLYRIINNTASIPTNLGVTDFRLRFFDFANTLIPAPVSAADLQRIQSIQITMSVENIYGMQMVETAPLNTQYTSAFWQQRRLSSRNYRNR